MPVRKYLFWKCEDGIRSYKVTQKSHFELMKPSGKDVFSTGEWTAFFSWFHKSAAITEDEYIDFCFLSEEKMESPLLNYNWKSKSSWDREEIDAFCKQYIHTDTFQIFYSDENSFVSQSGNIFDQNDIKKMYLKCIPDFSMEVKEKKEVEVQETSILNRYFMDKLKELSDQ